MTVSKLPKISEKPQNVKLREMVYFWYGFPGLGKTTLASGFIGEGGSKPLFLHTSSVKYVDAYKIPISSWAEFKEAVKLLDREKPTRYSHIVVDIIDHIWTHCRSEVCERLGIEHEGDMPHGKGWDSVKREFIPPIAKLCTLGYGVSFISHAKVIETRGRVITAKKTVPTLQGGAASVILPICEVEGYLGFDADDADVDSGKRWIFLRPTEVIEAKDWTGRLPEKVRLYRDPAKTAATIQRHLSAPAPAMVEEGEGEKKKALKTKKAGRVRPQ